MALMIAEKVGFGNRKLSSKMNAVGSGNYCIAILARSGSRSDRVRSARVMTGVRPGSTGVRLALLRHWRPRAPGAARLIPGSWPNRKPHVSGDNIM